LTINLEIEGSHYPFLVDTGASVSVTKPEIGKGQRMNQVEFTVKGITGIEIHTNVSSMLEFKIGKKGTGIDLS
jgi:predicted aspartyl protease